MSRPLRRGSVFVGFLALAAVLPLLGADEDAPAGHKYALLVGVRNYNKDELRNLEYTENDVNDLAQVLRDAGYKRVVLMTQSEAADRRDNSLLPTGPNIRDQLAGLLEDRKSGDSVLIALSGHGVQPRGEKGSFFCPMDARLADPKTLVPLADVYKALQDCPAGMKVLLVDACRNDPMAETEKGVEKVKLESVTRPPAEKPPGGVAALFSCSEGQQSYESARFKQGVFFHYVIEGLKGEAANKKGEVTLEHLAAYVKDEVPDAAKDEFGPKARQLPDLVSGELVGSAPLAALGRGARPSPLDCTTDKGVSAEDVKKAQEAWAKYLGRKVHEDDEVAPGMTIKFVLVPPGKFSMGAPKSETDEMLRLFPRNPREFFASEAPQHEVEITKPFYLGVFDVTQAQYEAATGKNPSKFKGSDLPVEMVNWDEADAFARKLSGKARDGLLYRLPTEAEWEYSCRGGRPSSQPFGVGDGASLSSHDANFDGDSPWNADKGPWLQKTTAVGTYEPNDLGLYDMEGNVYQWCADWHGDYPPEKATDPTGPVLGDSRVCRGGSWNYFAWNCRSAFRNWHEHDYRDFDLGFRLARVPSGLNK